ncbi:hypothetical protein [Streptomyces prasinopilosus]|uniref:Uncharacterized protein n=2 Tax=Streptomyces prasinopilosus TaxID=67344 RepID=A0A1G6LQ25_9ACTN|nr:hypothetical protein [Streptomyces prasinopilosus]SDC44786.1 hypothetical protein SAMN05216505_102196 [Streptomyces prasinopilosus]
MTPRAHAHAPSPVLTVDADLRDLRSADRLLHRLAAGLELPEGTFGCTHLVRGQRPRVVVSLSLPSEPHLRTVRERLRADGHGEPAAGLPDASGRAVLYPGASALTGTMTVAELIAASAISGVTVLGAPGPPDPGTRVVTRDHVRPQWQGDALVLAATPARGGVLVPFESPDPTPCCADH